MNFKDIAVRAVKTFVQTAIPLIVVTDLSTVENAALAGLAAGVSVLMNAVMEWSRS